MRVKIFESAPKKLKVKKNMDFLSYITLGRRFGLESFDLEAIRLRATRHELSTRAQAEGLVDMSYGRGALNKLIAERKRWGHLLNR